MSALVLVCSSICLALPKGRVSSSEYTIQSLSLIKERARSEEDVYCSLSRSGSMW